LALLETAFGSGNIAPESILGLAPYYDVQVQIAEALRRMARKESFDQVCEYITDQDHLRELWLSMHHDSSGRIELGEILKMLGRVEVGVRSKEMFRFLSHFATTFAESYTESHQTDTLLKNCAADRNRFTLPFLTILLARCVVTSYIIKVLDLLDPSDKPQSVGGYASLEAYSSALGTSGHNTKPDAELDPKVSRRWAQIHRRIAVSLLVNQRYWGREGKMVLATLNQPAVFEDLTPEHWLCLYQRVRAQGMASTFPEADEEFEDPEFLSKRAKIAVDSQGLEVSSVRRSQGSSRSQWQ
jgi:hypothetical protein